MARQCMYKINNVTMTIVVMQLVLVMPIYNMREEDDTAGVLRDRASLVTFMAGITNDPKGVLENWNSSMHACNWTGVVCNFNRWRVTQLVLSNNSLSGSISDSLSELFSLAVLELSNNSFTGGVPTGIGKLPNLDQLSLGNNQLEGPIPAHLGSSSKLTYVALNDNSLTGTVPETLLCNCSTLQIVNLSNNSLSGSILFGDHCELTELVNLSLWSNKFVGSIPMFLSKSTKMVTLDLESNNFGSELPSSIVRNMPSLLYLHLSYNNFTSDLDPFFASLSNSPLLTELEIIGNGVGGVIPSFVANRLVNLKKLHLAKNKIRGPIPPNISNLRNLTELDLSDNFLDGSIPPDLARLRRLLSVNLSSNLFSGQIHPDLGSLPELFILDLSGNKLSGPIPEIFSSLSKLGKLLLHNNSLSGTIPASLGNCSNLQIVDLSHNHLSGRIPKKVLISNLAIFLNLSGNYLEGALPLEVSKMDKVIELDLSSNNLTGLIPSLIDSCVGLESLNLSHNNFVGPLSESVGKLRNLKALDISVNRLSGPLPVSVLQKLKTLRRLNVSYNNFVGHVSREGVFGNLSMDSFEGNAELCGEIPGMRSCPRNHRKWFNTVLLPVIIFLSVICLPCILSVWLYLKRPKIVMSKKYWTIKFEFRPMNRKPSSGKEDYYPRVPYHQLLEATNGFDRSSLVGSGSFGSVYKGTLKDQTIIAVKVLMDGKRGEVCGSFKRECEVLKRTRHRNLMKIITTCSRPDFKALVLPFMSNGSLESWLHPSDGSPCGLSLGEMVSVAGDVAEGMAYLHHYSPVRVVHCDLKPSNVLLDEMMTAVVSDFGIAKLVKGGDAREVFDASSSTCDSLTGLLRGSIGYIAPEYGTGGHLSIEGDVFSFGVILLEMITAKRPTDVVFQEGSTLQGWVKSHYPDNLHSIFQESLLASSSQKTDMARDVVVELVELGLVCTQISPKTRPTMVDVAHEISMLKDRLA